MRHHTFALAAALVLLPAVPPASAQGPPQLGKQAARATIDLRIGALWPGREAVFSPAKTRFSFGVRIAPYLGQGRVSHRFSPQFAFDYIPVSTYEYFDTGLNSEARFREEILIIAPALGFDVVQTPRVDFTVRYGGAILGNRIRFELPDIYGQFRDVCGLQAFEGICPSRWNFVGNAGASLRLFPKEDFPLYFGIDYTRHAGIRNQLVGIIGFAF